MPRSGESSAAGTVIALASSSRLLFPFVPELPAQPWIRLDQAAIYAGIVHIYGYPLVTMDMTTRQQMTNVAAPTGAQAQMGWLVKMQTYRDVSYHIVTAPHAETFYTTAWIDVSREPWILSVLARISHGK